MAIKLGRAALIYLIDVVCYKFIVYWHIIFQQANNKPGITSLEYSDVALFFTAYLVFSLLAFVMVRHEEYTSLLHPFYIMSLILILGFLVTLIPIYFPNALVLRVNFYIIGFYEEVQAAFLCVKTRLGQKFKSSKVLVEQVALVFFVHVFMTDPHRSDLHLIRFLAITILHFPIFFTEIKPENFVEKCWEVGKFFVTFCLCRAAPALIQSLIWPNTKWQTDSEYFILARIFFTFLVIKYFTDMLQKKMNRWLRADFNYDFVQSLFLKNWTSPVYFLLFQIDRSIWNKWDPEMLIYIVAIHSINSLANVNKTIIRSVLLNREANDAHDMATRALRGTLCIFFSTIGLVFFASFLSSTFNAHLFIVIFFSFYVAANSFIYAVTIIFLYGNPDPNSVRRHFKRQRFVKSIMRDCAWLLLSLSMLWIFAFVESEITVLIGAVYYASELRSAFNINLWRKLLKFLREKFVFYLIKLKLIDDECPICYEQMTSGRVITMCRHCFHKTCLSAWFNASESRKCPICRRTPCVNDLELL